MAVVILGPPLGPLVSFGSSAQPAVDGDRLILSGLGTPVSAAPDFEALRMTVSTTPARETVAGRLHPVSKTGMGPRPFPTAEITWRYWLQATSGLDQGDSWVDLESRIAQLQAWYTGTFSYTSKRDSSKTYAGWTGQEGDLVGLDANGAPRYCLAQWVSYPDAVPLGQVNWYQLDLVFKMLTHWQSAPVLYDRGYRYDEGAVFG